MNKKIRFRKLFRFLSEKDEGYVIDAICYVAKRPHVGRCRTLDDEEAREKGYRVEKEIIQYAYYFFVDLWFVYFSFDWLYPFKLPDNASD